MTPRWEILPLGPGLDARVAGSKAARLGDALGAGLPALPGLVLPIATLRLLGEAAGPTPAEEASSRRALEAALAAALAALGPPPYAARSSSPEEDSASHSLAGLYRTELGVRDAAGVLAAAARCDAQARHPSGAALRVALGAAGAPPGIALLVQPQVTPRIAGVLFTRDPAEGPGSATLLAEWVAGSTTAVTSGLGVPTAWRWRRGGPRGSSTPGEVPEGVDAGSLRARLSALGDAAEALIGGPADLEWALTTADWLVLLQLRPITAWRPSPRPTPRPDGSRWHRDAEHNPAPLSALHASLVSHLDARLALPFRMRVEAGELWMRPGDAAPGSSAEAPTLAPPPVNGPCAAEELRRWWTGTVAPRLETALAPLEEAAAAGRALPELLPHFEDFYALYAGRVGPAFRAGRRALLGALEARLEAGLPRAALREALRLVGAPLPRWLRRLGRLALRQGDLRPWLGRGDPPPPGAPGAAGFEAELALALREIGALGLAWDLASPTLAEQPGLLRQGAARLAERLASGPADEGPLPAPATGDSPAMARLPEPLGDALVTLLRLEEEDDLFFARGLAALRRGALTCGERLTGRGQLGDPSEVFGLPLEELLRALADPAWSPPRPPGARPEEGSTGGPASPAALWGVGTGGGVVVGRVRRLDREEGAWAALPREVGEPLVAVCSALIPTTAAVLAGSGAAAVVADHGGLLSHGAILARELGIPAVLGTGNATTHLRTGQRLLVDADLGLVLPLDPGD